MKSSKCYEFKKKSFAIAKTSWTLIIGKLRDSPYIKIPGNPSPQKQSMFRLAAPWFNSPNFKEKVESVECWTRHAKYFKYFRLLTSSEYFISPKCSKYLRVISKCIFLLWLLGPLGRVDWSMSLNTLDLEFESPIIEKLRVSKVLQSRKVSLSKWY